MTIVNTVWYKRLEIKYSYQKRKKKVNMWYDGCVNLTLGILSQQTHVSNHHLVYLKCIIILCPLHLNKTEGKN